MQQNQVLTMLARAGDRFMRARSVGAESRIAIRGALTIAFILAIVSPPSALAESYAWDFRNGHFDNLSLVPMGPGAVNLLRPRNDGLHITVPAGRDVKSVGFSPRFKISGDFEVTLSFTLLNRTKPKAGFGTGPSIYLSMGSTKDAAASVGRQLRPDGRDVYGVFAARVENGVRVPTAKLINVPPKAGMKAGRLRLKRTRQEIEYSVLDESGATFRSLATLPVSDADVTLMRVGLSQSDPQSAADILLHDVRIEASALPQLPSAQSRTAQLYRPRYEPPIPPKSRTWLWSTLAAGIVASALGAWVWRRYRSW